MASLTIRKLDDAIRDELRLRAARNGRSVEDEVAGDPARTPRRNSASFRRRLRERPYQIEPGTRLASTCRASP